LSIIVNRIVIDFSTLTLYTSEAIRYQWCL